jgi:hypothetical protein
MYGVGVFEAGEDQSLLGLLYFHSESLMCVWAEGSRTSAGRMETVRGESKEGWCDRKTNFVTH